jgi:hypothetical protein
MSRSDNITGKKKWKHLNETERKIIEWCLRNGLKHKDNSRNAR